MEGLDPDGTPIQGPLIQVGDTNPALDGMVHDISFPAGMQLKDPYINYPAFLVTWSGANKFNIPYNITTGPGTIVSGGAPYGNGFDIEACSNCDFYILTDFVLGTAYTQKASSQTGTVTLHLQPGETAKWLTAIDPAAVISQAATVLSTGSTGSIGATTPPVSTPFNVASGAMTVASPGTLSASVNSVTGSYFADGLLTCIDAVYNLNYQSVSTGTLASTPLQFALPVRVAFGSHDTIAVSVINGGSTGSTGEPTWPVVSASGTKYSTSQIRFAPVSNQLYGQIEFQGSSLNTPSLATNLYISSTATNSILSPNIAYTFTINGCYQ